jgi:hypothetical protein
MQRETIVHLRLTIAYLEQINLRQQAKIQLSDEMKVAIENARSKIDHELLTTQTMLVSTLFDKKKR